MAITFNETTRIFTLTTAHTTYQMQADAQGYLLHLYYGARTAGEMDYLLNYGDRGFSGNPNSAGSDRTYSLDALPQEYPSLGTGDFRNYALNIENADGSQCCNPVYITHEIAAGKYTLKGLPFVRAEENEAETLKIILEDPVTKVELHLLYGVLEKEDIITRSVIIKNAGKAPVTVKKAQSACLDFLHGDYDLIKFYGRHAMERNMERMPVSHESTRIGSRRGTSSHQYNPGVILAGKNTNEDSGSCYGMLFVYSGNFLVEAEKDQYDQTRIQMGLTDELFAYPLEAGAEFTAPEVILSYTNKGLSRLSQQYHHCIMNHICQGKYVHANRPVLINSWEAAYFDFTGDTIVELAKEAKALGIDMVVMDDGWFGKRNSDNCSLGDWKVNEEKITGGLKHLVDEVNKIGLQFGIWFEPEMISPDSDLYRAHPDWAIQIQGREATQSRNQYVLDFSRPEVRDYAYECVASVLRSANIAYVKWDMNRHLTDLGSAYLDRKNQNELSHRYVLGLYQVMETLTERFPQVLFESCSSGGGRFDAGMLYYMPQTWTSDNTDAVCRLKIQHGTSFLFPTVTMGAHVSACPNHQVGRTTPLATRFAVAAAGNLGYELDLKKLLKEEKKEVREQIAEYKRRRRTVQFGTYYRLADSFQENQSAWNIVSEDGMEVIFTHVQILARSAYRVPVIRLKGLDPDAVYTDCETGQEYGGDELMYAGIRIPRIRQDFSSTTMVLRKS